MAYPASRTRLHDALIRVDETASSVKELALSVRSASEAGPIPRTHVIQLMRNLTEAIETWDTASALPGIVQHARDEKDDPTLDVAAEFVAMRNAATDLRDWIHTNFPKAGDGAWQVETYSPGGVRTPLNLTTAQMAPLRTRIDAFAATIA